jgi:hypothetical protein
LCASRIKRWWTRCKRRITGVYLAVRAWVVESLVPKCTRLFFNIKRVFSISEDLVKHGFLFLSFGLLLVTVEKVSEKSTWELMGLSKLIPTLPGSFCVTLRWVLVAIAFVLICVFFWLGRKELLKRWIAVILVIVFLFLVLWLTPPLNSDFFRIVGAAFLIISGAFILAVFVKPWADELNKSIEQFKFQYWTVFLIVNLVGWARGLSSIPEGVCAIIVELVGWLGLAWILVIIFMMFRAIWQSGKTTSPPATP